MISVRIIRVLIAVAGLGALTLGLLFWIANINLIVFHMLFGLTLAITLLVASIMALVTRGIRIWGIVGVIYALIVPAFGMAQSNILTNNLHWIIQTLHMLVGIGAMVLAGLIIMRYATYKQARNKSATVPAEAQTTR